ncbi:MAG: hypothetical protein HC769_11415 [Cyanobacteria bacterium CRU_2_1]|nr:hypothetical protein [Cyanobacteria bacterium CRU_2_1]
MGRYPALRNGTGTRANAQSIVREKGCFTLIDTVKIRYLSDDDKYWAEFANFGHKYVHVPERYVREYDRLLVSGIWAQVELRHEFDEEATGKKRSPSALKKQSVIPGLLVLGDLSIQGNIKAVLSLSEPLQLSMDSGARRALIPIENKRHFLEVSADIMERVDPIFYSDPMTAALKALGI